MAVPAQPQAYSPQASGFAPPPPPPGYKTTPPYTAARSGSAGWALTLALLGAVLAIGTGVIWFGAVMKLVVDKAGPTANQEQINRAWQDILAQGNLPRHPALAGAAVVAALASIAGLVTAIRSLVQQESGRGLAIAACVIGALFLLCQVLLMMLLLGPGMQPST